MDGTIITEQHMRGVVRRYFVAVSLVIITVISGLFIVSEYVRRNDLLFQQATERVLLTEQLKLFSSMRAVNRHAYAVTGRKEFMDAIYNERAQFSDHLARLSVGASSAELTFIRKINSADQMVRRVGDECIRLQEKRSDSKTTEQCIRRLAFTRQKMDEAVSGYYIFQQGVFEDKKQGVEKNRVVLLYSFFLFFLLFSLFLFWISKSFARTLHKIFGELQDSIKRLDDEKVLSVKNAEALRESEQLYRFVAKATNNVVWDFDLKTKSLWFTEVIEKITGIPYQESEQTWDWWLSLVHPDDRRKLMDEFDMLVKGERLHTVPVEYRVLHRDGTYRQVISRGYLFKNSEGLPSRLVGSTSDLTPLRMKEVALAESLRARDEMIGVISHELKNPLTAMVTGLDLVDRLVKDDAATGKLRQVFERFRISVNRMTRLVSDLLDITRIEARRLVLNEGHCDLKGLLDETLESMKDEFQKKQIAISLGISPDVPASIYCDKDRLAQILFNLVGNAIKFTPSEGKIDVAVDVFDGALRFKISDNGCGIEAEDVPRLFDRFWQAKGAAASGSGLGLPITKGLVEAHGGKIWVESVRGIGSVFVFTLPNEGAQ